MKDQFQRIPIKKNSEMKEVKYIFPPARNLRDLEKMPIMPIDLVRQINLQQMADLLAFLKKNK